MGNNMMAVRVGVNGGLYERKDSQCLNRRYPNYIWVESVEEYSKKIEEFGRNIKISKMETPGLGWWALGLDTKRNHFGILV